MCINPGGLKNYTLETSAHRKLFFFSNYNVKTREKVHFYGTNNAAISLGCDHPLLKNPPCLKQNLSIYRYCYESEKVRFERENARN